ncbi:hypothetical protein WG66_002856 [Moniliophthora roreri]|nr:hypothetical protein WG66_002856 [Moniliophthora roreri]
MKHRKGEFITLSSQKPSQRALGNLKLTDAARARQQDLLRDPDVDVIDPFTVFCRVCTIRLKLSDKSAYDASHWRSHKAKSGEHIHLKKLGKNSAIPSSYPDGGLITGSSSRARAEKKYAPAPRVKARHLSPSVSDTSSQSSETSASRRSVRPRKANARHSPYPEPLTTTPFLEEKSRRSSRNITTAPDKRGQGVSLMNCRPLQTHASRSVDLAPNHRNISPISSISSSLSSLTTSSDDGSETSDTSYTGSVASSKLKPISSTQPPKFRHAEEPDFKVYLHSTCSDVDADVNLEEGTVSCWRKWNWARLNTLGRFDDIKPRSDSSVQVLSKEDDVAGRIDVRGRKMNESLDSPECTVRMGPLPVTRVGYMFCDNLPPFELNDVNV